MIHRLDERFREEARRYRLAFACPDCASFDPGEPSSAGGRGRSERCSLGFPIGPHVDPCLDGRDEITFCKAFELR